MKQFLQGLSSSRSREGGKSLTAGQAQAEKGTVDPLSQLVSDFAQTVSQAGGQSQQSQDMRSDLVEQASRSAAFKEGPIQGNPADGHNVKVPLGSGQEAGGEIFDRPVELSDDFSGYENLKREAQPVIDDLRRSLYPNFTQVPETERLRTTGTLDPARLPLADVVSAIFRRYKVHEQADKRGRPVLMVACDGSGSLNSSQIHMLKILCCGWLLATAGKAIQVLAGLYHSGTIRQGLGGPLVQWIYHPRKTPATGRKDAARALLSLPDSGTGAQSDALSLAFMMDEAAALAAGRRIYLILLTDCAWNTSFNARQVRQGRSLLLFPGRLRALRGQAARHPGGPGGCRADRLRRPARQGDHGQQRRAERPVGGRRQNRPLRGGLHEGAPASDGSQMKGG